MRFAWPSSKCLEGGHGSLHTIRAGVSPEDSSAWQSWTAAAAALEERHSSSWCRAPIAGVPSAACRVRRRCRGAAWPLFASTQVSCWLLYCTRWGSVMRSSSLATAPSHVLGGCGACLALPVPVQPHSPGSNSAQAVCVHASRGHPVKAWWTLHAR